MLRPPHGSVPSRNVGFFPGRPIGILPFRIRHFGMMRHAMIEVVLVHVGIHPDPVLPKDFMVLGPGQRSEEKQFEDVKRQLTLDNLDVAQDRGLAVARKTR